MQTDNQNNIEGEAVSPSESRLGKPSLKEREAEAEAKKHQLRFELGKVITLYKSGNSWLAKFDDGTSIKPIETAFTASCPVGILRREIERLNPDYDVWVL